MAAASGVSLPCSPRSGFCASRSLPAWPGGSVVKCASLQNLLLHSQEPSPLPLCIESLRAFLRSFLCPPCFLDPHRQIDGRPSFNCCRLHTLSPIVPQLRYDRQLKVLDAHSFHSSFSCPFPLFSPPRALQSCIPLANFPPGVFQVTTKRRRRIPP